MSVQTSVSAVITFVAICVAFGSACSADKASPTTTAPAAEEILSVVVSPGIIGNPTSGETRRQRGSTVSFTFSARPRFEKVRVTIDGRLVATTGQVLMDRAHSVVATADTILGLSRADSVAIQALSSAAARGAVQEVAALMARLSDSLLATAPDSAARIYDRTISRAFVPERDAPVLVAALQLADSRVAAQPAIASSVAAEGRTQIIFVNGILTTRDDLRLTTVGALTPLVRRNGFTGIAGFDVSSFHNTSALPPEKKAKEFVICTELKAQLLALGETSPLVSMGDCYPTTGGLTFFGAAVRDFEEAAEQVANLVLARGDPSLVQRDARKLADTLAQARRLGQRVILVSHSQGNLMVAEALSYLKADPQWSARDYACVGWVSIAPPVAPAATPFPSMNQPSSVIVKGTYFSDMLYGLLTRLPSGFTVRAIPNELSVTFDSEGWLWARFVNAPGAIGRALHQIRHSYFMPATAGVIGSDLVAQVVQLQGSCPVVPLPPPTESPGSPISPGPELPSDTVTFTWRASPGATAYHLRVLDIGTNALITATGLTQTSFTLPLTTARQYRWDVTACSISGCSAPTAPLYFQTPNGVNIPATPENPSPGSPTSPGPLLSSSTVTFTWTASRGATGYNLRVLDVGSNNFIDVLNSVSPAFTLTLNSGRTYLWYVTACNAVGCNTTNTAPRYFRTP